MARGPRITAEQKQLIVQRQVYEGKTLPMIATELGISPQALYQMRKGDRVYQQLYNEAMRTTVQQGINLLTLGMQPGIKALIEIAQLKMFDNKGELILDPKYMNVKRLAATDIIDRLLMIRKVKQDDANQQKIDALLDMVYSQIQQELGSPAIPVEGQTVEPEELSEDDMFS